MATAAGVRNFQPSARILSRSRGDCAAGKAAYNARCRIENDRTGKVYSFEHLPNRVISEHFFPAANSPEWAKTRAGFWNGVEQRENRTDSQLAMDWVIALPHELEANHQDALRPLTDFIRENFQRRGYTADLAFHPAHDHGDERNFHAHLMVGIRRFEEGGQWSAKKDGVPNEKELGQLRERMTAKLNKHLEKHGYDIELDCRSYQDRGSDQEATLHLGKHAAALERRGIETEVGDKNRQVQARNAARELEREMEPQPSRRKEQHQEQEAVSVASAVDRLLSEERTSRAAVEQRAERDLIRGTAMANHARELLSAVRRLFVTLGVSLGNVIALDPGDLRGQGRLMRTEALDVRRKLEEQEAANYRMQVFHAKERAQERAKDVPRISTAEFEKAAARVEIPAAAPPASGKRETLLEKLKREAAERGETLDVKLRPERENVLERVFGRRRKRNPLDPDEPV